MNEKELYTYTLLIVYVGYQRNFVGQVQIHCSSGFSVTTDCFPTE